MMEDSAIGLTTGPLSADPDKVAAGIDAMPSSAGDVFGSGFEFNPSAMIGRALGRSFAETGVDPISGQRVTAPEASITADEANAQYGIPGELKFDNDIPASVARSLYDTKHDELARADILRRRPAGFGSALGTVGAEFGSSALDPLNVAASFIPVVGEARYAAWLADAGSALARAGIRAGVGAAQGFAGTAPIVALTYGLSKQEQSDMSAADALLSLAYGGILGGGLHAIGGAFRDAIRGAPETELPDARAIEAAPLATREAMLRTAIAQVAEGRPVEVMPLLDMNALRLMAREAELRNQAGQLDEFLAGLDVAPEASAAADRLARLQVIENQLADATLTADERRPLLRRRDELLINSDPETLRELAAPLEIRRQAEAQRANIADMLAQIEAQRTASAANVALSPLPKLQDDPRFAQAMRYAAGEPLPEDAAISALADQAGKEAPPIGDEIATLEAALAQAQANGDLPADIPDLAVANAGVARAEAMRRGYAQAAMCLFKGGA